MDSALRLLLQANTLAPHREDSIETHLYLEMLPNALAPLALLGIIGAICGPELHSSSNRTANSNGLRDQFDIIINSNYTALSRMKQRRVWRPSSRCGRIETAQSMHCAWRMTGPRMILNGQSSLAQTTAGHLHRRLQAKQDLIGCDRRRKDWNQSRRYGIHSGGHSLPISNTSVLMEGCIGGQDYPCSQSQDEPGQCVHI